MTERTTEPAIPSPCVNICELNEADVCVGCHRSLDEIARWSSASPAQQRAIVESAAARLGEAARLSAADTLKEADSESATDPAKRAPPP